MGSSPSHEAASGSPAKAPRNSEAAGRHAPVSNGTGGRSDSKKKQSSRKAQKDEFHSACLTVFRNADVDNDGRLGKEEFWSVLRSKTLALNLSEEEMEEIRTMSDTDGDGYISYEEFIPVVRVLLKKIYAKKATDWNDWCKITNPQTKKTVYLNKRTGQIQSTKPEKFNEVRVEETQFEDITLIDGTELTTYVNDEGVRMYMDWDSQDWKKMPEEWQNMISTPTAAGGAEDEEVDPRVGEYEHPTRGVFATYLFENVRNTRLYFDEELGQWARMPLAWERNIPEVTEMLQEMDRIFPKWKNVNEQLLALRECNYDLADALVFAEINWAFDTREGDSLESKLNSTRPASRGAQFGRRVSHGSKSNLIGQDLGKLSVAAANHIHELERENADLKEKLQRLELEVVADQEVEMKALSREKTQFENTLRRRERMSTQAQERVGDLSRQILEQNEDIKELKAACAAKDERVATLETQLAALTSQDKDALKAMKKANSSEVEKLRAENAKLKAMVDQDGDRKKGKSPKKVVEAMSNMHEEVKKLQEEYEALSAAFTQQSADITPIILQTIKTSRKLDQKYQAQLAEVTKKYTAEAMQRKLLYNKVQELRGNIRVFCRFRKDFECIAKFPSNVELLIENLQGSETLLDFDRVYGPKTTQEEVFVDTKPIIMSCVDGYNVCIIAYGQTGSGKTHTMMGTIENPGVNRRAISELLSLVQQRQEDTEYQLSVSLMEIYNENVYDLLDSTRKKLSIHHDQDGVYVDGLKQESVDSTEALERVMALGDEHRSVSATKMNIHSSRSHMLMQVYVNGYNKISKVTTAGKLTLVDLAGSERVSKSEASGARLVEAAAINKSLSALGQVFKCLATNAPHIPYRNSKLTHVLQDSLGGDSKTAVFINCSPVRSNLSETHCTLNFGKNIRTIELGPAKKNRSVGLPPPPKRR